MGMVAVNHIGTGIDGSLGEFLLGAVGVVNTFFTPVESADHDLGTVAAELGDTAFNTVNGKVEGGGIQTDLQTAFSGIHGSLVLFNIGNACLGQCLGGGFVTGRTVVFGVVVGQRNSFHGGTGHDLGIGSGAAEREGFGCGTGGGVCQGAFQIDDCEIIVFKVFADLVEGIIVVFADGLDKVIGIAPVAFGAAQCAVAGERQRIMLFFGFGCGRLSGCGGFGGRGCFGGSLGHHGGGGFGGFGNSGHSGRGCFGRSIVLAASQNKSKAKLCNQQNGQYDQNDFFHG